jgi:hypothetical protein
MLTVRAMMVSGRTMSRMAAVYTSGLRVRATLVSGRMLRSMAAVLKSWLAVRAWMVSGRVVCKMAAVFTRMRTDKKGMKFGKKGRSYRMITE